LKDAEGRIQIYVARDDISTDEEKTMYNVVFKNYWILAILVRGTVFRTQVVKSLFIFMV
jgi:lysyl-tRNA synthetase class 2